MLPVVLRKKEVYLLLIQGEVIVPTSYLVQEGRRGENYWHNMM
jgi:hypothetical protein